MKTDITELVVDLLHKSKHLKPRERATFVTPQVIFTVFRDHFGRWSLLCDVGYNKLDNVEIDEESLREAQKRFGSGSAYH